MYNLRGYRADSSLATMMVPLFLVVVAGFSIHYYAGVLLFILCFLLVYSLAGPHPTGWAFWNPRYMKDTVDVKIEGDTLTWSVMAWKEGSYYITITDEYGEIIAIEPFGAGKLSKKNEMFVEFKGTKDLRYNTAKKEIHKIEISAYAPRG